ncbi:protein-glutamate O-methyltransferase CheR [Cyanobacteria bacterium FACHB-63]|nr:protein-glutamate O-methyltransferase CheR [Cyanobacteria bacterium FACHB-63]
MSSHNCFLHGQAQSIDEVNPEFETLLDYLKRRRDCDLTSYKRPGLMRRFQNRMQQLKIDTYQKYLQHLQCHSDEHLALLNDVLINFTGFFRDRNAWIYLATEVIPRIIASQRSHEVVRVWSAGCASGPEIYSVLILLSEVLGVEFCLQRVQCYATDADADALQRAQRATYSDLETTSIPPQLLEKYFEQTEQGYVFHRELRNLVTFEQHNLIKDAPLSDIDLLICRNVLMYFTPEAQEVILSRFHHSLKNIGFLFLGQAELVMNDRQMFSLIDFKQKIYTKEPELEDDSPIISKAHWQQVAHQLQGQDAFWQTIFESSSCDPLADLLTKLATEIKDTALQ